MDLLHVRISNCKNNDSLYEEMKQTNVSFMLRINWLEIIKFDIVMILRCNLFLGIKSLYAWWYLSVYWIRFYVNKWQTNFYKCNGNTGGNTPFLIMPKYVMDVQKKNIANVFECVCAAQ